MHLGYFYYLKLPSKQYSSQYISSAPLLNSTRSGFRMHLFADLTNFLFSLHRLSSLSRPFYYSQKVHRFCAFTKSLYKNSHVCSNTFLSSLGRNRLVSQFARKSMYKRFTRRIRSLINLVDQEIMAHVNVLSISKMLPSTSSSPFYGLLIFLIYHRCRLRYFHHAQQLT